MFAAEYLLERKVLGFPFRRRRKNKMNATTTATRMRPPITHAAIDALASLGIIRERQIYV
jgi:hypothetical protein